MKHKLAIICLVIASFAPGCSSIPLPSFPWSSQQVQSNPTAEALFAEGMDHFKNKRYSRAIDRLQRVKAEFPFSPQLTEAELKLAEAYYLNRQYPEAIAAFKEFQTLHPTNENIPFAIYHLGLAHFDQFTSTDRDQKMTEIARGYFETVVRNHPNSSYTEKAKEKLAKCNQYLAEHAFNIARFYFNDKNYPAARDRFEEILRRYPNNPTSPQALYYLGESYRLEKNTVKAALAYEALAQHYPETALAKQAQTQLAQLEKEKPDPLKLLLMTDRRPASPGPESSQQLAVSGQPSAVSGQQKQEKELNLVAKKEVVHEEPNSDKGFFRRVADTVNPVNWFSSSDDGKKETPKDKKTVTATRDGSRPDAASNRQLLSKIDESLNQRGTESGAQNPPAPQPPAAELPKEPSAPPPDTSAVLADVDTGLEKAGKKADGLPPTPEAAPVLKAASPEQKKTATAVAETPTAVPTSELISSIDEALKRKGVEAPKEAGLAKLPEGAKGPDGTSIPASQPSSSKKVELAPRLPTEKGPLFLETGEFQVKDTAEETKEAAKPKGQEATQPPKTLAESVVKSPAQAQTIKPAEKKTTPPDAEEQRSPWDQIREDMKALGGILNPLNW